MSKSDCSKIMDYKTAGVDVQAGRDFVDQIRSSVESTFRPEVIGGIGGFGGFMRLPEGIGKPVLVAGSDGVGTKLELAQTYNSHFGVGIDLVAMCINDVITSGAKPLFFLDYIATGQLGPRALSEVIDGISNACKTCNCSLLGGETAEMPGFYSKGKYDMAGFCVGVVDEPKIIDGNSVKPGDQIIGLKSSGIHSNGFSLVRKVLDINNVDNKTIFGLDNSPLIEALLKPTELYFPVVNSLLDEGLEIKGMAHITGGGLPENLPRCLPKGLNGFIDQSSWSIPEIFLWLKDHGNVPMIDLWNTFNMGIGFCLIVSPKYLEPVMDLSRSQGFCPSRIGVIQEGNLSDGAQLVGLL